MMAPATSMGTGVFRMACRMLLLAFCTVDGSSISMAASSRCMRSKSPGFLRRKSSPALVVMAKPRGMGILMMLPSSPRLAFLAPTEEAMLESTCCNGRVMTRTSSDSQACISFSTLAAICSRLSFRLVYLLPERALSESDIILAAAMPRRISWRIWTVSSCLLPW